MSTADIDTTTAGRLSTPSRLGLLFVSAGLAVTVPVMVLTMLALKGSTLSAAVEQWMFIFSAVGLAVAGTSGGAYIGHTVVTRSLLRWPLSVLWLIGLAGMLYLMTPYLLSKHTGLTLQDVLTADWLADNVLLVVWALCTLVVPELIVVGCLVASYVHTRAGVDWQVTAVQTQLDVALRERNALADQLHDAAVQHTAEISAALSRADELEATLERTHRGGLREEVLTLLGQATAPLTVAELVEQSQAHPSPTTVGTLLRRLTDAGEVQRVDASPESKSKYAYQLPAASDLDTRGVLL